MDTLTIILSFCVVVWLFVCLAIYKSSRRAAWLAGSTVAACLFFLGATVAASFLVKGALALAPLWLGISVLSFLHLQIARQQNIGMKSHRVGGQPQSHFPLSFPTIDPDEDGFI